MLIFVKIKEEHLKQILQWRIKPEINRYMYTDVIDDFPNHKKWYERITNDDSCRYWLISYNDKPIGVISINNIDRTHRRCTWGYYIGDEDYRLLGGIIPPYLYNYCFYRLNFNKLIAEVIEGNDKVIKLHKIHGYRFVGIYKKHIIKKNAYYDVHVYELLKEEWNLKRDRYARYNAIFEE